MKDEDHVAAVIARVDKGSICATIATIGGALNITVTGVGLLCVASAINYSNNVNEVSINAIEGTTTFGMFPVQGKRILIACSIARYNTKQILYS